MSMQNQKAMDLHFFTNKYARERVEVVVDELQAVLITDDKIGQPEMTQVIGRELALAFLKGVQLGEEWSKKKIIPAKKPKFGGPKIVT